MNQLVSEAAPLACDFADVLAVKYSWKPSYIGISLGKNQASDMYILVIVAEPVTGG